MADNLICQAYRKERHESEKNVLVTTIQASMYVLMLVFGVLWILRSIADMGVKIGRRGLDPS